eukprot:885976-Rhodomonas_salina.1
MCDERKRRKEEPHQGAPRGSRERRRKSRTRCVKREREKEEPRRDVPRGERRRSLTRRVKR